MGLVGESILGKASGAFDCERSFCLGGLGGRRPGLWPEIEAELDKVLGAEESGRDVLFFSQSCAAVMIG